MKFELSQIRPAPALLRHRRRGRQHPDRRGADAADHLGPGRGIDRPVLRGRSHHPEADAGRRHPGPGQGRGSRGAREERRLLRRREAQDGDAHRERHGQGRGTARAPPRRRVGRALRSRQHAAAPPREPGAARPHAVPARRRLRRQGRRGRHRRRVHRPTDGGPPLERRAAPGRRGQGEGEDRAREPDARHHHLPELLPQVPEALGHDRHGRHRGRGVQQDLQARRARRADEPADAAHRGARPRLPHRAREVRRHRRRDHLAAGTGPPGARRHGVDREVREALDAAQAPRHPPRGAQREAPRAGSRDRRAGGPPRPR